MKRLPNVPPRPWARRLFEENWRLFAACQWDDPDLFFPVSSTGKCLEQVAEAKAVCALCLVRRQCLEYALETRQVHGIWGGLTESERIRHAQDREAADRDAMNPPATA